MQPNESSEAAGQRITVPNTSRMHARKFAERAAARGTGPHFRVLDAGAGSAPYRDLFAHVSYEAADVAATQGKDYSHIDHICDVVDIPVEDGRYDLVWCSQVLEHVREPERALREFHRITKPGGEVWLTAPFYYQEHEQPWDFFRYTQFAWQHFADLIGFEVVEIERMEGFFGTVAYSLEAAAAAMPPEQRPYRRKLRRMAAELAELELVEKRTDIGFSKNYQVVFRRP
ncbi:class I SAM-dependent methyltransferase [Nocardioides alcanivorans]|uniref:class I SAM-dependent methyltransferase n=1 Tax=Nocardioides alcanivorans TaxID=2897352 RepID=UPI001F30490F|nr:class I SAM-dependent methyltransferase [Nocardioides alcanivorans]